MLKTLSDLASETHSELTKGEKVLLKSLENGSLALLGSETDQETDPRLAGNWDENHVIRASFLRWLCTNKEAVALIDNRGIILYYAKITGGLDLSFTTILFPLVFYKCVFSETLNFGYATLSRLNLDGSRVSDIWAISIKTTHDISLSAGFQSQGELMFDYAQIGSEFGCSNSIFTASKSTALSLFSAKINGSLHLFGSQVYGIISLNSASIGRNLSGGNLQLSNPLLNVNDSEENVKPVLLGSQLSVGGSLFLNDKCRIVGQIELVNAKIGGDFDCAEATFDNSGLWALRADAIKVGQDIFFAQFKTNGIIRLIEAEIGGSVRFNEAEFLGDGVNGVDLDLTTIKQSLVWREVSMQPQTVLSLVDTSVFRIQDDFKSWPAEGNLLMKGLKYTRIEGSDITSVNQRRKILKRLPRYDLANLSAYGQLAAALKAAGHDHLAKKVLIDREDRRYGRPTKIKSKGWGKWMWGRILKYTIGYGYIPSRAIIPATIFILLGWFIFDWGYKQSLFVPISDGVYKDSSYLTRQKLPVGYQLFNPLFYSIDSFLPILDLHQEAKWLPNADATCKDISTKVTCGLLVQYYLYLHIMLGWALTTLVVAGFTGIVRKE